MAERKVCLSVNVYESDEERFKELQAQYKKNKKPAADLLKDLINKFKDKEID